MYVLWTALLSRSKYIGGLVITLVVIILLLERRKLISLKCVTFKLQQQSAVQIHDFVTNVMNPV